MLGRETITFMHSLRPRSISPGRPDWSPAQFFDAGVRQRRGRDLRGGQVKIGWPMLTLADLHNTPRRRRPSDACRYHHAERSRTGAVGKSFRASQTADTLGARG